MFTSLPQDLTAPVERPTFLVSRPLRSTPTPASRSFTATTSRSASERRVGTQCLRFLPSAGSLSQPRATCPEPPYRRSPSPVPCKSRRPGSRRLHAGHHLANNGDTRQAPSPENSQIPSFRCHLNCANDASTAHPPPGLIPRPEASGTSSRSPPDASSAPFPRSLTTTVFS